MTRARIRWAVQVHTTVRLPAPPEASPRSGFPWAATVAPVVVSVVLWVVTGSVFGLLFAILGPVVAVAGLLDGARSRRRAARRALERFRAACDAVLGEIRDGHAREHARLRAACPTAGESRWTGTDDGMPVLLGTGHGVTGAEVAGGEVAGGEVAGGEVAGGEVAGGDDDASAAVAEQYALLHRAAGNPPLGPVVVDASAGVGIVGPPVLAAAVARAVAVQLAGLLSPADAEVTAPTHETWVAALPHRSGCAAGDHYLWQAGATEMVVAWAGASDGLPLGCGAVVEIVQLAVPFALGAIAAERSARELARRAAALGAHPPEALLPGRADLGALLAGAAVPAAHEPAAHEPAAHEPAAHAAHETAAHGPSGHAPSGRSLAAPVGVDGVGPVIVDLVAQGPHALVAGTTGSGKSELLVSWVLAMAHGRSPAEVAFLLIDFKGGAAFAPLAGLPHVVATLSDLDARLTRRAVLSLRAELLRRERVIAAAGARSLDGLPAGALARLVIVVDEFAALVASGPELQDVFADLAARGRSLGLHLVLCTQRPAGVVRDAVLANIGLRISLRVTDRADALAMLGDDAAARLPADPRGRAIVLHDGVTRGFQVALAAAADAERIRSAAEGSAAGAPWCDPLPERIELQQLPAAARGWAFGLIDLPAEQSQPVAVHDAATDGSLLVIGAAGAGVTTALTTLAESARRDGCAVTVLPPDPAGAWQALAGAPSSGLMIIDDLDVLLDRFGDEHRHDFAARLATVLRGGPLCVIAGIRRLDGEVSRLASLFGSRLVLRQASREDQLLAAGTAVQHDRAPHALHDQTLPPGAGTWRGEAVQVAIVTGAKLTVPEAAQPPGVTPLTHPHIAVITTHPRADAEMLAELGWSVVLLGPDGATAWDAARSTGAPLALVGDPDDANAQWALLTAVRRGGSLVLRGCTTADHRALLPGRGLPPPLGPDAAECWLATADGTVRARITQESVANQLSDH